MFVDVQTFNDWLLKN